MTTQADPSILVGQDSSPALGSVGRIDTPTVDSPIGRDAVSVGDAYPRAEQPAPIVPQEAIPPMENEPAADPFAAEYDQQVADKAAIFDLMQRDPSMGGQVENFLAILTGRAPQQQQVTPVSQPQDNGAPSQGSNELMQLRQQVQSLSQQMQNSQVSAAKQQIEAFGETHTDFGRYRQQVGQLVTQHGLSLADAYTLVKARAGETVTPQSVETARANAAGRQSAPEGGILEEARQTIAAMKPNKRDRNAALRVAWDAATRHHNQ